MSRAHITADNIPIEIWRQIMLCDPQVYMILSLTCRIFHVDTNTAKDALTRPDITPEAIIYHLPSRLRHRGGDLPAAIFPNAQYWIYNNRYHRDNDQPAVIRSDGTREWWVNGNRHRIGGPAVMESNGTQKWLICGRFHRDGDLPAVVYANGAEWYYDGKRHRDNNKPAVIRTTVKQWWSRGVFITSEPITL